MDKFPLHFHLENFLLQIHKDNGTLLFKFKYLLFLGTVFGVV